MQTATAPSRAGRHHRCGAHRPLSVARRVLRPAASAARSPGPSAAPASAPSPSTSGAPSSVIGIRRAEQREYWPAADLHCRVFMHDQGEDTCKVLGNRVDRIVALQVNDRLARDGAGKSTLLLAFDGPLPSTPAQLEAYDAAFSAAAAAGAAPSAPTRTSFPSPMWWMRGPLGLAVREGLGVAPESLGLLGVAAVDSFCDLVPPRELDWRTDGAAGWYRREGYAYISNVAVLPSARRRGVARQLMAEAEALAKSWGCRAIGLHCNPKKTAPWNLYTQQLGFRPSGVVEPAIMPYLQGRPPDRCHFLVKLVPGWREARQAAAAAAGQAAAAGGKAAAA
ncbi:hypothetical protein HYH03_011756 [Edaphochlamys debaryana]|uniref:N-acetyltransferase domain-containing protein n=1 Tax=Edaphochlamys debaryana TaxID=47281 RepID=A0A836BV93_9CHLO|nr:hypothetical protein HYH03_011756 [Edaphochlamys debaryana]|eukprot:KAG2489807.1 hypothetical protein HYH03_011756 [Edaphochlamys debaryana]